MAELLATEAGPCVARGVDRDSGNCDRRGDPRSAAESPAGPTHAQVRTIRPTGDDVSLTLKSFCLAPNGQLVTLVAEGGVIWGASPLANDKGPTEAKPERSEIRVLDAEGILLHKFPVDFVGHSVNVAPDGSIYVGGNGLVAKYTAQGKQMLRTKAPNMSAGAMDEEVLRARAEETLAEQATLFADALASLEKQQEDIRNKSDDELTEEQREIKADLEPMIAAYKQMVEERKAAPPEGELEAIMQSLAGRQKTINAIAANDKYVFVTCAAPKGYGYVVWRTDLDFNHPLMAVEGLRGCCGQMDVQCCGEELVVAENARHRVVRFDADGKELVAFGKRSRDGKGVGFGGCCNPMNTRLVDGTLYVAESDGTVKRFSTDGEFLGLVGKANVEAGCKSSIVAAAPGGDRVYYFDVQNSAICVLERQSETAQVAN